MPTDSTPDRWIVLTYRVPRQPTAARVYVWRKLRKLGAIALQDAAWVLPATPKTQEHLQWLATEISELGGEARIWSATLLLEFGDEPLRNQFLARVEADYKAILKELRGKRRYLSALARRFQQALAQDYFSSPLGPTVRKRLIAMRELSSVQQLLQNSSASRSARSLAYPYLCCSLPTSWSFLPAISSNSSSVSSPHFSLALPLISFH